MSFFAVTKLQDMVKKSVLRKLIEVKLKKKEKKKNISQPPPKKSNDTFQNLLLFWKTMLNILANLYFRSLNVTFLNEAMEIKNDRFMSAAPRMNRDGLTSIVAGGCAQVVHFISLASRYEDSTIDYT